MSSWSPASGSSSTCSATPSRAPSGLKENGIRFVQAVGRGEAKAAEPQIQEVEGGLDAGIRADTPDRAALLGVLEDLHACRSLLDALRRPYDRDV